MTKFILFALLHSLGLFILNGCDRNSRPIRDTEARPGNKDTVVSYEDFFRPQIVGEITKLADHYGYDLLNAASATPRMAPVVTKFFPEYDVKSSQFLWEKSSDSTRNRMITEMADSILFNEDKQTISWLGRWCEVSRQVETYLLSRMAVEMDADPMSSSSWSVYADCLYQNNVVKDSLTRFAKRMGIRAGSESMDDFDKLRIEATSLAAGLPAALRLKFIAQLYSCLPDSLR